MGDGHLVTIPQGVVGDRLPWGGERQGVGGGGVGRERAHKQDGLRVNRGAAVSVRLEH